MVVPPGEVISWESVTEPAGLEYVPVRHYGRDGELLVDDSVVVSEEEHPFADRPEVVLLRPDSLIFDLVKSG